MDYPKLAQTILKEIGGNDNIVSVMHCATRLRFQLKDEALPIKERLEAIQGVLTVIYSGGQVQLVIGEHVNKVYLELQKGITSLAPPEPIPVKKGNLFEAFVGIISGVFLPVLGVIAASGILKGFLTAALITGLMNKDEGTYQILFVASDAMFYFMPVILGFSAGKTFNTNPYITATIGAALVYPAVIQLHQAGTPLSFLHLPVMLMNYVQSVIPIIIAAWFTARLDRLLQRVIPVNLQLIFVPFFLLIIVIPATLLAIGPISIYASKLLADGSLALYHLSPVVAGFLLAGIWQIAVIFGLHWAFIPIFINNIAVYGFDPINALLYCTVFAQTGAALAVAIKTRQTELKSIAYTASLSGFLGITEPAIYGVNLPSRKPFIMASIGSAAGGAVAGFFSAKMFGGFATGGVFGIPMFISAEGADWGFYGFCISLFVAFLVASLLTITIGYKNNPVALFNKSGSAS
ncbi:protein-N(pi)-phosphohistidine--sugar phosphotransferase [Brenneria nigrifluens DSM 30175 = ATCC 13028]|uniref:Protein-N(Pi)-phosphohistidine--sugar phosphotransferase n=2 Tax=Pectobacteriaceae TaxID=1903410 RepID=A0A2U1UWC9_9GAMM|nr:Protein-N(pi)-phosphohistidine--sugar phosphotransferase [Brenneria sp. EniD312]PWC25948.1 protein-N(pi)-phosphohistidine--sugar phosphotransferase [Brenneria nigrifluens DSM 30175 = ATCC 13028]QCR06993.1 protein-N(pi)-phosphohistidine--sugar phosphotransferase [Brenneria nigrifluens DSM 30175 = ATCC 13028]